MRSILAATLFFTGTLAAIAARAEGNGAIQGTVLAVSTRQPIPGASVRLEGTRLGAVTDTAGVFTIRDVPAGTFTLVAACLGFARRGVSGVVIADGTTAHVDMSLDDEVITIGAVTTTARRFEAAPTAPVSSYSFSRDEIFRNPGSQGDVFRAIGILPGVSSGGAQYSAIAVRGQGTSDNVYMVDDLPMFELSHLGIEGYDGGFDDPNGGRFSIFAPRVVDHAHFEGGGFAAEYGRRSSSALALGLPEGRRDTATTSGQFDLLGFTLLYDGPVRVLGRTGVFASARYQNFALVEDLIHLRSAGLPAYGDCLIKTTTDLGTRNQLSVIAMIDPESFRRSAKDVRESGNVDENNHPPFVGRSEANKGIVGLNLRTLTGPQGYVRNVLYFRASHTDNSLGAAWPHVGVNGDVIDDGAFPSESDLRRVKDDQRELGYRGQFAQGIGSGRISAGVDLARVDLDDSRRLKHADTLYVYSAVDPRRDPTQDYVVLDPAAFNSSFAGFAFEESAYLDLSLLLFHRLTLDPGVRFDHTGFTGRSTVAPRLSGSAALDDRRSLNFAAGIYDQDPLPADIASRSPGQKLQSERVLQSIFGVRDQVARDLRFVAEGWYKDLDHLLVRPDRGASRLDNRGTGFAYGADVSLVRSLTSNFYGQIAYSYMVSKRDDHDGLGVYDYTFSQPHTVSVLASYRPGDPWVLSAKFRYATGRPRDRYRIHADVFDDPSYLRYSAEIVGKDADRAPDFASLDLRADYRVRRGAAAVTGFLDVVDALDRFNQNSVTIQPLTGKPTALGLGVFPSFGLRVEF